MNTERQEDRQRDRETDKHEYRETDSDIGGQTDMNTDRWIETDMNTERQNERRTDIKTDVVQTTDSQTVDSGQAVRQTAERVSSGQITDSWWAELMFTFHNYICSSALSHTGQPRCSDNYIIF